MCLWDCGTSTYQHLHKENLKRRGEKGRKNNWVNNGQDLQSLKKQANKRESTHPRISPNSK